MSSSLASHLRPLALVTGAVCAAGIVSWILRRESRTTVPAAVPGPSAEDDFEDLAPDSFSFEPAPESLRVSAQPTERVLAYQLLDDYGALSPEELGAAFLAAATDTAVEEPPPSIADESGFQIFERGSEEQEPDEALDDAELASIFARRA